MTYKEFVNLSEAWNVSTHFHEAMRMGLTGGNSKKIKLNPNLIEKNDLKFMNACGFILCVETMEVEL